MLRLMPYRYIENLGGEINVPPDGILSRTLHNDDDVRVVLFGFAPGQELTEHTSKLPAILHVLDGEARLKLGDDEVVGRPGTWVHMSPNLPHAIYAKTQVTLVLVLVKAGRK